MALMLLLVDDQNAVVLGANLRTRGDDRVYLDSKMAARLVRRRLVL